MRDIFSIRAAIVAVLALASDARLLREMLVAADPFLKASLGGRN